MQDAEYMGERLARRHGMEEHVHAKKSQQCVCRSGELLCEDAYGMAGAGACG